MDFPASATSRVDLQASFSAPKGVTPIQGTVRRASWPGRHTGWWLSHPSEKYESQMGSWNSQYMEQYKMFQTTNQDKYDICMKMLGGHKYIFNIF